MDLKPTWITVVLCFCYKPPKSWTEFWVLLQTGKQVKVYEEVPYGLWSFRVKIILIRTGRKELWINTRLYTGSVGNLWLDKISLQTQVKFSGFCDISQRLSGCLWTWNSKRNPAAPNLNTARQRLKKNVCMSSWEEYTKFHLLTLEKQKSTHPPVPLQFK